MSVDQVHPYDIVAMNGASAALALSEIPVDKHVGAVRIGKLDGDFVVNPEEESLDELELDLIVAGTDEAILMVEAGAKGVSEAEILDALDIAHAEIKKIVATIEELRGKAGKEKLEVDEPEVDEGLLEEIRSSHGAKIDEATSVPDKLARQDAAKGVEQEVLEQYAGAEGADEPDPERRQSVEAAFATLEKEIIRRRIAVDKKRPDGRAQDEIRPIECEVDVAPRVHGSALFTRGETQILSNVALGTSRMDMRLDTLGIATSKRFWHHYNFPPFSVGEAGFMRGPKRRDIGHGALAERALLPVLPTKEEFPYTIRVVSETLESNGSSSMASTCGSTLALMDAGVPIKEMIGGIAMGLVTLGDKWTVLTDIQGLEDHYGDMDFKVTGSAKGVTALQMDIKIKGISLDIMRAAFQQAREARLFILEAMRNVISEPRPDLSHWAPRIETIKIQPDKIREVIGPGGKMVRAIQSETGTTIELEDDGTVRITGAKAEGRDRARAMIEGLTKEPEVGEVYDGKVTRIMSIGAFVEYLPGKEGLVRISELSTERVNTVEDAVKVGDKVKVKVAEVDRMGRVNLSIRAVNENGNDYETRQRAERERYRERDERGGGPRPGGDRGGFRRGGPPRR